MSRPFLEHYLRGCAEVVRALDVDTMDRMVQRLVRLREKGGRLFLCGVGGSAGNCSHAVSDFRKLAEIEAYTPVDNVSELTARTNDEGWERVFADWLDVSQACRRDVLMVFSVGGGSREHRISVNLVEVVDEAKRRGMDVLGIVGRDGGYTKQRGDLVLVIPTVNERSVTPHTEALQAVIWHAMVCDPRLAVRGNTWEGLSASFSTTRRDRSPNASTVTSGAQPSSRRREGR